MQANFPFVKSLGLNLFIHSCEINDFHYQYLPVGATQINTADLKHIDLMLRSRYVF